MSMDYIRRHYSVPAKRGGKVKFQGKTGTILGIVTGKHFVTGKQFPSHDKAFCQ